MELNQKKYQVPLSHPALLKWLEEKLRRNNLRVVCEVRTWRCCVYVMLSRSFAMKMSRGGKTVSVIRTFMMQKTRACFTAEKQIMKTEVRHRDVQTKISEKVGERIHLLSAVKLIQSQSSLLEMGGIFILSTKMSQNNI